MPQVDKDLPQRYPASSQTNRMHQFPSSYYPNNNFIVISGDYGMRDSSTFFCEKNDNVVYIANGIYDKDNDVILDLQLNNNNYFIEKVLINNNN